MKKMQINALSAERRTRSVRKRSPYLLWLVWIVWLPFLIPLIIELFAAHISLLDLAVSLAGVALFIAIFLWATLRRARQLTGFLPPPGQVEVWLPLVMLTVLSIVLTLINGKDWLALLYFVSGYAGGRFSILRLLMILVAFLLLLVGLGLFLQAGWPAIEQGAFMICIIGIISIGITGAVRTSWELHAAREEIARLAVMAERSRIARDLHDLLGHNLSLITLKSELAGRLVGIAPERAAVEIKDIEQVARTTLQEVREAVASYRQPTLENELHSAQEILAAAGIAYHYAGDEGSAEMLPTPIEAVLAWTVREGVTNIIRHSRAQQCTIRMVRNKREVQVEIINDGAASAALSGDQSPGGSRGNGLRGLAERVAGLGGQFDAGPHADGEFRLAVAVPLAYKAVSATASSV